MLRSIWRSGMQWRMATSVPDWSSRMACIQTGHMEAKLKHCRQSIVKTCHAILQRKATSLHIQPLSQDAWPQS